MPARTVQNTLLCTCLSAVLTLMACENFDSFSNAHNPNGLTDIEGSGDEKCVTVDEHQTATLACPAGQTIESIDFASYGTPDGSCDSGFAIESACHAETSMSIIEDSCLDQTSCSISASNGVFGDPCPGTFKMLSVAYLCSGAKDGGAQNGLMATYFDNDDFTGESIERVDPVVDFDWGRSSPDPSIGGDTFSARWTGFVEAEHSETYTFYTVSDDGVRFKIDGQIVIDNWTLHSPTEDSGTIKLVAGQRYAIELEYYENGGGAVAKLLWSSSSVAKQTVPQSRLFTNLTDECAEASEGETAQLSCPSGKVIGNIGFASYGLPDGSCKTGFAQDACHASSSRNEVEASCLNQRSCRIEANNEIFGDPCPGKGKKLAVTYSCVAGDEGGGDGMPVFLLAGQSNMLGNVDRDLFDQIISELENGSSGTRQQRLIDRLTSWYQNFDGGYASYGYSAQSVNLEASELVRLNEAGLVNASLTEPYSKVYCTSIESPTPNPLALNCGNPFGPELVLGHVLGTTSYSPTSLIKVAKGGTTLYSDWLPPTAAARTGRSVGELYKQLSQRIQSLGSNPASVHPNCAHEKCRWAGFIWFQGENDSMGQAEAGEYKKNLANLISDVRSEVGSSELPVIVVGIGHWAQKDLDYGTTVVAAQKAIVTADPYAEFVPTDDLSGYYHYDPAAQLIIGERIGNALVPMMGSTTTDACPDDPNKTEPGQCGCGVPEGTCGAGGDSSGGDGIDKCVQIEEWGNTNLYCSGGTITKISFASYGTPSGICPNFSKGTCHASNSASMVRSLCLNKQTCNIEANNDVFGDPCAGVSKKLAVVYTCSGDDGGDGSSYNGSGRLLRFEDHKYILNDVDSNEAELLEREGFTKNRRVSVGNWTNIFTIQATSLVDDKVLRDIAVDAEYLLRPIVERYPDRLRKVLDRKGGTFNVLVVYGSGWGLSGGMGDGPQVYKRWGAYGGGLHHEMGHIFDLWSASSEFRSHVDSILSAEDAAVLDRYCGNTVDPRQDFIKEDGGCLWSEFIAEQYHWMSFPDTRVKVQKNLPEVYRIILKYIPTPSDRVPALN